MKYVNGLSKNSTKPIGAELVEQTLKDNDENFLQWYAKLIDMQLIALENLGEVVGVCQAVHLLRRLSRSTRRRQQ
jgi:hypothetical protein